MFRKSQGREGIQYEPDEKCPPLLAITSAVQIFIPNTISLVMLAALVVRASGESEGYLSWVTFTALAVTGASMVFQTLRLRHLGSGRLIVTNFNVPFLAVSAIGAPRGRPRAAGQPGGGFHHCPVRSDPAPGLPPPDIYADGERGGGHAGGGFRLALHHQAGPPFRLKTNRWRFSLCREWPPLPPGACCPCKIRRPGVCGFLPITVAVGLVVAAPLGLYNADKIADAPWLRLPEFEWPGLDMTLGRGLLGAGFRSLSL